MVQKRATSEAKNVLIQIFNAEKKFYPTTECYTANLKDLGVSIPDSSLNKYSIKLICGCGFGYKATAESHWTIATINQDSAFYIIK